MTTSRLVGGTPDDDREEALLALLFSDLGGLLERVVDEHVAVQEELGVAELQHPAAGEFEEQGHLQAVIPTLQGDSVFQDQVQVRVERSNGLKRW